MLKRRLRLLWRWALRLERPRQLPTAWGGGEWAAVMVACLLVGLLASWPWLVQPSLQPGMLAPFTARAPKTVSVVDAAPWNGVSNNCRAPACR